MMLSDSDHDLLTRTVLAEAGPDASPVEQAAVAHVVLNRLGRDDYPKTMSGVLFQKNAFEPWGLKRTAPNNPMRYSADDPSYARASQVVDGALSGAMPDPTNGADRFQNPDVVAQRRQRGLVSKNVDLAPSGALRIGPQAYWATPTPPPQKVAQNDAGGSTEDFFQRLTGPPPATPDTAKVSTEDFFQKLTGPSAADKPNQVAGEGAAEPNGANQRVAQGAGDMAAMPEQAPNLKKGLQAKAAELNPTLGGQLSYRSGQLMDLIKQHPEMAGAAAAAGIGLVAPEAALAAVPWMAKTAWKAGVPLLRGYAMGKGAQMALGPELGGALSRVLEHVLP